jgi:hypothetical protein
MVYVPLRHLFLAVKEIRDFELNLIFERVPVPRSRSRTRRWWSSQRKIIAVFITWTS